ncbi:MAG: alpha-glucosidase [Lachnospiraceae bacterium]|nr:alpha-glucosidase [Lachnospiraceae bacterium]
MQKKWWHSKTAYQIYPKSFMDSNGDGIGDLKGIIGKLDYLKNLGIDIIWLSPIYCSPLADQGYDISDYYNIDPRFGTMEDMDLLLAEAKKRDMHIVMDLVVNHCSDEHEWFKKACEDPDGPYGKYFYIYDHKDGEKLPSNLRSYFGGSVWEPLPGHPDKIYFHAFHKKQPDLNWENEEVRKEIYKMINWWLDKGLAGFRIDAIINIKKALPFKDYPADRDDNMSSVVNMIKDAKGVGEFLNEMADETFRKYDAFTVGEVFDVNEEDLPRFIGDTGYFSSMFDFEEHLINASFMGGYMAKPVTPEQYKEAIFRAHLRMENKGFLSNIIENHDEPRGVSHYIPEGDVNDVSKKMLAGVYFFMPGLPFIYQGQEIGMENKVFESIDEVDDIATIDDYKVALEAGLSEAEALKAVSRVSRDNARTPFQWDDTANAGFTTGKPWLGVNKNYKNINAASQINDENSVFAFYKKMIALRNSEEYSETLVYGKLEPVMEDVHNLLAYKRIGDKELLIIANYDKAERTVTLPSGYESSNIVLSNSSTINISDNNITLPGYGFALVRK